MSEGQQNFMLVEIVHESNFLAAEAPQDFRDFVSNLPAAGRGRVRYHLLPLSFNASLLTGSALPRKLSPGHVSQSRISAQPARATASQFVLGILVIEGPLRRFGPQLLLHLFEHLAGRTQTGLPAKDVS
jgi:hypothetical protein